MATSADRFCTLCDPTSTKADEWCSECDAFLCLDCIRHHRTFKLSNQHSTIPIKDYEELPDFVKNLTYICEDHDERVDLFCPVHNCSCCIRCALMSHKSCDGVALLKDFTPDSKTSLAMKDIEQTLGDMQSFTSKLLGDKENNKQEIHSQKSKILDEIRQIRTSLNKHLNQLEQTLINSLNETVSETFRHIDTVIHDLKASVERIDEHSKNLNIIKSHATDLQTFLSMPQISYKVVEEEKYIKELGESNKLGRKEVVFKAKVEDFMNTNSFGDVQVKNVRGSIYYVKEKEKQAQIVGVSLLSPIYINNIYLKQITMLHINVGQKRHQRNQITGCNVLINGNFLFSEFNIRYPTDRLTLCDNKGRLIQLLTGHSKTSLYDVTSIDENTCAVSAGFSVEIINITTGTMISKTINGGSCYGNSYNDGLVIFCCYGDGIRTYNTRSRENKLLIKEDIQEFSYVCNAGNRVINTSGTESVTCCDMTGKVIWKFEDASVLRSPRGVTVDKDGYCYVSGEKSRNVVVISPDGKSSREVCKVSSPKAICFDMTRHQILVSNSSEAFLFQISENV